MNLQPLIERYIAYRQALGESFKTNAVILRAFGRAIGARADIAAVRARQVRAFLDGKGPITRAWYVRHSALLGFYRYAITRGYVAVSPLPAVLPQRPPPFVPYIYTQDELRRLLRATDSYQRKPQRHGARHDAGPRAAALRRWSAPPRSGRPRTAPTWTSRTPAHGAPDQVLQDPAGPFRARSWGTPWPGTSAAGRHRLVPQQQAPFFTMRTGTRLNKHTVEECFLPCASAGRRPAGRWRSYQPRLHDLRHTFAVHRLTSWYRQGADVQKLLPQLSVYLGHVQSGLHASLPEHDA